MMFGDSNNVCWKHNVLATAVALFVLLPAALAAPQPSQAAVPAPAPVVLPEPQATFLGLVSDLESSDLKRNNANVNREAVPAPVPEPIPEALPVPIPKADAESQPNPVAEVLVVVDALLDNAGQPISPRDGYCNGAQYCAFSGAVYITGGGPYTEGAGGTYTQTVVGGGQTPAQQAQCPAGYPQRCDALGQSDYCCPANNYCAYDTNHAVACCPNGQTCQGAAGGYQPTSTYYTPTTYYAPSPQPTTVYVAGGAGGAAQVPTTTTEAYYGNGAGYCSTLIMSGATLPTTAQGDCGTILILPPSEAGRLGRDITKAALGLGALQVALGAFGFGLLRIW